MFLPSMDVGVCLWSCDGTEDIMYMSKIDQEKYDVKFGESFRYNARHYIGT